MKRLLAALTLNVGLFAGVALTQNGARPPQRPDPSPSPLATPSIPAPTPWPGAVIEDPIAQLTNYLLPLGIAVVESKLIEVHRVRSYHTINIEWKSYRDAPELVDLNSTSFERINELRIVGTVAEQGTMQALYSPAMTTEEIFVAAVNAQSELLYWKRIRDPRIVRAESSDANGRMQGRTYHRSTVEMHISIPDNPGITNVRLFLPQAVAGPITLVPLYDFPLNLSHPQ